MFLRGHPKPEVTAMKMTAEEYARRVKQVGPRSPLGSDCLWAFCVGGGICLLGEVLRGWYLGMGLEAQLAGTLTSCTLIVLSALLTTLGLYQKLAAKAGAGSLVPITGFANAVVSPAMDFRAEGLVTGMAAKMFLIAGNNTGTGILQNIMDANGTGFICESEADTLSTAIGSDYGHWSDTLRKAFDHDRLSYNRRTDQEYREIKKSYLSVLLSGTPAQVKALIPSAENGLFSRQLFYYMPGIWQWVSQFTTGDIDIEEIFTTIGLDWKKKLDLLKAHGLHTLRLTDEQKQEFNDLFSELFTRSTIANGREMNSSIARMAVNICRIMSVVAMLRALENPQPYQYQASSHPLLTPDKEIATDNIKDGIITRWDMTITPEDFKAVLNLVKPLYQHATHILSFLPPSEVSHRANADRDAFFEALGIQFTRAQLLEQATTMGIKPNTALTWLKRLVKQGLIVNLDGKGTYAHARVCVC